MISEQKQRIEQIRERVQRLERAEKDPHVKTWDGAYYGDVHFLLSLVKSKEAERNALSLALKNELTATARPAHRDYECMTTIADETQWCATCAARAEYLRGRSDAATSMRSACVEKVRAKAAKYQALADDSLPNDQTAARTAAAAAALNSAANELESVSIETSATEKEGMND